MTVDHAVPPSQPGPAQGPRGQLTVLALVFGTDEEVSGAIAERLGTVLENLPGAIRRSAVDEVTSAAWGLLDVNPIDMIVAGWRKHHELTAAAHRTLLVPGSAELTRLANHQITVTEQPYINVMVNGIQAARLDLKLSLTFDISALIAVISYGTLIAVHSGHCDLTAALAIQDVNVFTRSRRLDLPGVISLHQGIRLLPAGEYPAGLHPVRSGGDSAGSWPTAS